MTNVNFPADPELYRQLQLLKIQGGHKNWPSLMSEMADTYESQLDS